MNTGEIEELIATLEAWDKWELGCGRPVPRKLRHSETASALRFLLKEREDLVQATAAKDLAHCDQLHAAEWQTIETAPKNGTHVMVFSSERCRSCIPDTPGMAVVHWDDGQWNTGRIVDVGKTFFSHKPSHWMPLPSPPQRQEAEE